MEGDLTKYELDVYIRVFEYAYNLGVSDRNQGLYINPKALVKQSINDIVDIPIGQKQIIDITFA